MALGLLLTGCSKNPEKTIEKLIEAVENRDPETLFGLVVVDKDTYWTVHEAKDVIEYFLGDYDEYGEQLMLLDQQAMALKNKTMLSNEQGLFYFNEDKELKVRKYELKVDGESLKEGAEKISVKINDDKKVELDGKKEMSLGLFGPGKYQLKATAEYPFAKVESDKSVTVMSLNQFNQDVDLGLEGKQIMIKSTIPNTILLVNGEEVTFDLSIVEKEDGFWGSDEDDGDVFGPISEGVKLQGLAELPWGEAKSKEIEVTDKESNYNVTPAVFHDKKEKDKVTEIINGYAKNRIAAYVNLDHSVVKNVSESIKNPIMKDINEAKEDDDKYKGEALGTRIDYSRAQYYIGSGGRHYVKVPVEFYEKFLYVNLYMPNQKPKAEYQNMIVELEFITDDKKWIIAEIEKDYSNDRDYMMSEEVVETEF